METSSPTLNVENLCVDFTTRAGPVSILKGVSLSVDRGEIVGLVVLAIVAWLIYRTGAKANPHA